MKSRLKMIRIIIVDLVRKIFKKFQLILLTDERHQSILLQRAEAVKKLVDQAEITLSEGLVGVVFSRDRAFQLHALLESYFEKVTSPVNLIVIYKATNPAYQRAYQEVKESFCKQWPNIEFIEQTDDFRSCLLRVISNIQLRSIFFLVDDIIFINHVDLSLYIKINPRDSILSLRLSPQLRNSYTTGKRQLPPNFLKSRISEELLQFQWFEQGCEWADPWSVDGNMYSTAEIKVLTSISQFKAPNSYEDALKSFGDLAKNRIGYCFSQSKILNLAINRVQNEIQNLSGEITPEYLLEQWNKGLKMDRGMFETYIPLSPHEEHEIRFRSRV